MTDAAAVNENSDSLPPQLNWNALFRGDRQTGSYNACVGNNGAPDIYYYADGYADSVSLLIDGLTEGRGVLDTLIYPICFCLRHSVELTVKGQIQDLNRLARRREQPITADENEIGSVLNQHDILNLWEFFADKAIASDRRYQPLISASDPLIRCIAQTDPTGQTFRYSYSNEARKHLTDVSVINVVVLREQFGIIRENLEKITYLTEWLLREYRAGSFTRNLNREDLQAIAGRLPPRNLWGEPSAGFDGIRDAVKTEYRISSREFSAAISKIENCRDMARIIGMQVNIPGLSAGDLIALNDIWKLAWDRDALVDELREDISGVQDTPMVPVSLYQELLREQQVQQDTQSSLHHFMQWATAERLAGLQALLDAGDYFFCEEHDLRYEWYRTEMTEVFTASPDIRDEDIAEVWSRSVGRRSYPTRVIDKLIHAGFVQEAAELEVNLFT